MLVLGVDPGLAHMGIALVDVIWRDGKVEAKVDSVCVYETKPVAKKHGVRKGDDNMRRAREQAQVLHSWMRDVSLVCYEAQSFGMKGAVAVRQAGTAFGLIASAAELYGLPVLCVQPTEIKRRVVGNPKATKEDVINWVVMHTNANWMAAVKKSNHEHGADAVCAVHACLDDDTLRACLGPERRAVSPAVDSRAVSAALKGAESRLVELPGRPNTFLHGR